MGLLVDGLAVIGSAIVPGKKDLCVTFLGKVPNKFEGGRISMNLLETNFKELPQNSTGIVKEQYAQAFILRRNHGPSYVGLLDQLKDIRLLLDQRSEAESMWVANAPLIVYATVEMHESDRVLQHFGWRQQIPPPLRNMDELHNVDLWGKNDKNWQDIHVDYIDTWDHKIKFSAIFEPFFISNMAACLEWFRVAGNLYMLSVEAKSRQLCRKTE
ncbi:hypothetical protein CXB51_019457 [Gossypium anomalum]|uniref:Uncharacterized protein n=1 Tax=Gossypium anomalum TaxID=47600 RepID=A0A8J6CVI0_9ROSI|nr:hypothetical protein CXB51_019457 [Gossypium anomalum]